MKRSLLAAVLLILLAAGCTKDEQDECVFKPETSGNKVTITLEQLQDSVVNIKSKDELVALFTRQPLIRDYMFRRTEYPGDSVFLDELYSRFNNPHFDTLLLETNRVFGDGAALKAEFEAAFSNVKYYYPDFTPPRIQTIITGLDTDMFVTDSLIIVSLDFYLGRGAKYRPKNVYNYILRKYDPDDIVPSAMLIYGIDGRFNKTEMNDKTVLADMVAYGKAFYFAKHMLPCTPDSTLIWYTPDEIKGSRANEDLIWARFIESNVLFATSHVVKKDYLGERPVTIQVGEKCPGRIGQWVGWRIVNKYMESHPDITLPQLMNSANAQQLFKESHYKPERR
jgi:hypothetical protein